MKYVMTAVRLVLIFGMMLLARQADYSVGVSCFIAIGTMFFIGLIDALELVMSPTSVKNISALQDSVGVKRAE
jgi:hypothetical protein